MNITWCPGDVDLGVNPAYQRVLSRAYPQHAAGILTSLVSDPYRGKMTMSGNTLRAEAVRLWIPGSERVGTPVISGGEVLSLTSVAGGYLADVQVSGTYILTVDY